MGGRDATEAGHGQQRSEELAASRPPLDDFPQQQSNPRTGHAGKEVCPLRPAVRQDQLQELDAPRHQHNHQQRPGGPGAAVESVQDRKKIRKMPKCATPSNRRATPLN